MDLAAVVPTLDSREQLAGCLDAFEEHAADVRVVVVNGPSTDGTSGLAKSHPVVDRLVEVAERNLNCARNAGIAATEAPIVAFVGQDSSIEPSWEAAVRERISPDTPVVTGPVHRAVTGGVTTEKPEEETIRGRRIRYFDGGNVAFRRSILTELDGFDEYLDTGGARDMAHRIVALEQDVEWEPEMAVLRTDGDDVAARTASEPADALGLKYRALSYRAVKNYGLHPAILVRLAGHAVRDGVRALRDVLTGTERPSTWVANGQAVLGNLLTGLRAARRARRADMTPRRNPNGLSTRTDRAVATYER